MWLELNYDLLKNWKAVIITSFVTVLAYQALVYLHPENLDWVSSEFFSFQNLLQFVLVDQILIECITIGIIFQMIVLYVKAIKLTRLHLSLKELLLYELKFVPLALISFFVFAPFTLTTRFLFHHLPVIDWELYFNEYFYSTSLYVNYLIPAFLFTFGIVNANLIILYNQQLGETKGNLRESKKSKSKNRILASDEFGELFLDVERINWISRENRKTFAVTTDEKYRLKESISEIENKLDPNIFIQINRSSIVNLGQVLNYSFWENDKYVVRMKGSDKEFVMSRERLQKVKGSLLGEETSL